MCELALPFFAHYLGLNGVLKSEFIDKPDSSTERNHVHVSITCP